MSHSSGFLSERHSPLSSSEPVSGSTSPLVIKPATIIAHKPRSSSMNSNCSAHSNHNRSLSIISLESPRNSIVSFDDGFTRPPRNDSNVSLSSMVGNNGGMTPPSGGSRETLCLNHKIVPKASSTAITSDEDSEVEQKSTFNCLCNKKGRYYSEPAPNSYLKKDFEFQYGINVNKSGKHNNYSNIHVNPYPNHRHIDTKPATDVKPDIPPLPLMVDTAAQNTEINDLTDKTDRTDKVIAKKIKPVNKTNRTHQSMYLKKKLIYSKDLQLELMNSNTSMGKHLDTRFTESAPSSLRSAFPNLKAQIKDFENEPIMTTLEHQNKLITKLNEKWNKSLIAPNHTSGANDKMISDETNHIVGSRKRSRQYLFEGEDDTYDDYDN